MKLYGRLRSDESKVGTKYGKRTQIGQEFSLRINGKSGHYAVFQCDCGRISVHLICMLKRGRHTQCNYCKKATHRAGNTPEHRIWCAMIQRCTNPNNPAYHNYGGRGIKICERWRNSFENFLEDVGYRPTQQHEIDRIDNDGNYEPGNIRWVLPRSNSRNRRTNRPLVYKGKTYLLIDLSNMNGISMSTLHHRLKRGWTVEQAVETPLIVPGRKLQDAK